MTKQKGKLIVIEGGDGSGKATQAQMLVEKLEGDGQKVCMFSFPRYYDSRAGKLIGELLSGKHGDFMSMSPYVSSLPYVLDRVGAIDDLKEKLSDGYTVICDRYAPSNLAHQNAKLPEDERLAFTEFIEGLEYDELGVPKPDLVLYLSVPADVAYGLVVQKGERGYMAEDGSKRDHAERNLEHQEKTRDVYLKFAAERDAWMAVDCAPLGHMRSKEDIHEDVAKIVAEL